MTNEIRIFPHLSDKPRQREESYRKLWTELYRFIKIYAHISPAHYRIQQHLERTWPEQSKGKFLRKF